VLVELHTEFRLCRHLIQQVHLAIALTIVHGDYTVQHVYCILQYIFAGEIKQESIQLRR
jgi:hypothetical protein